MKENNEKVDISTIYEKLSAPFPPEAVQRASAAETKKGYDTTGIGYQWCVNRFNEVLGLENWGYEYQIIKEKEGTFRSGASNYEITTEVSIWILSKDNVRKCIGGHISSIYSDALKGAITNAFKKAAAFWGVGRQAYEGSIDTDITLEDEPASSIKPPQPAIKKNSPAPEQSPDGTLQIEAVIEKISKKKGKKGDKVWTLYGIMAGGVWYNTFDRALYELAEMRKGKRSAITYKKTERKGNSLISIAAPGCTANPHTCDLSSWDPEGNVFCEDGTACMFAEGGGEC